MRDTEFVADLLRLKAPWTVSSSKLDFSRQRVDVFLEWVGPGLCPTCDKEVPKHDHRERVWRDLDMCADQMFLHARVPRVNCPEHGIHSVPVPWAEGRSEFTDRFERLVILLLLEMSIAGVSRRMQISWDSIDGIMKRAVDRGLASRKADFPSRIGIDEKAYKKGHKYFTIVSNLDTNTVIWIGEGRTRTTIDSFWKSLSDEQKNEIEGVAMDMWPPYYESTLKHLPDAVQKIVFDKFHIASYLSKAVDKTRLATFREMGNNAKSLKGTKYVWLRNGDSLSRADKQAVTQLRKDYTRLGRAWSIKEQFRHFWNYKRETVARRFFDQWYFWATHSRIPEIIDAAKTIKRHFTNILTYLKLGITNAAAESLNSKIQWIKYQARGFRSRERFERAIFFHCGGLDLFPTHSNS